MMEPNPYVEFPDFNLTDRQLLNLALYEIAELKAELRAVSSFIRTVHSNVWTNEKFDNIVNKAQDGAIVEMTEHAKALSRSSQKPPLN